MLCTPAAPPTHCMPCTMLPRSPCTAGLGPRACARRAPAHAHAAPAGAADPPSFLPCLRPRHTLAARAPASAMHGPRGAPPFDPPTLHSASSPPPRGCACVHDFAPRALLARPAPAASCSPLACGPNKQWLLWRARLQRPLQPNLPNPCGTLALPTVGRSPLKSPGRLLPQHCCKRGTTLLVAAAGAGGRQQAPACAGGRQGALTASESAGPCTP